MTSGSIPPEAYPEGIIQARRHLEGARRLEGEARFAIGHATHELVEAWMTIAGQEISLGGLALGRIFEEGGAHRLYPFGTEDAPSWPELNVELQKN